MLDLTQQKTNSVGIFSRVNMKRDSRSDSLIYDIELSFLIEIAGTGCSPMLVVENVTNDISSNATSVYLGKDLIFCIAIFW